MTKLASSDAQADDQFGRVAVNGDTAVVGAPFEDARGSNAGAAYVYDLLLPNPTPTPCSPEGCPTPTIAPTPTSVPASGDTNCDRLVDAIDSALVLQLNAGLVDSLACEQNADVNRDGNITSVDAALILQFIAGLLLSLPR